MPDVVADDAGQGQPGDKAWTARLLLRGARAATLATVTEAQPFASLVTPACTPDLAILLLLSDLSEHTRHLRAEPRCSLLVTGTAETANPQTAPRLTVTGMAERCSDATLQTRFLAVHPYAALYAGFGDFAVWRIRPLAGLFVGGFARATRLRGAELAPDPTAVAAIAKAESGILAHCNGHEADAMAAMARAPGPWRMTGLDVDGCDLVSGERTARIAWSRPAAHEADIRRELGRLMR